MQLSAWGTCKVNKLEVANGPKSSELGHSRRLWLSRNGHSQKVLDRTRYWPEGMSMPGNTEILAHGTREGEDHPNDFSRENGDGRHEEPSNVRAG